MTGAKKGTARFATSALRGAAERSPIQLETYSTATAAMIDLDTIAATTASLVTDEGFRSSVYQDHLGFWTLGFGTCVDSRKGCGITEDEATILLENRLQRVYEALDQNIPWWANLTVERRSALLNMAYQMGVNGLLNFKDMLAHMKAGEFGKAADEALDSKWARQTPKRAYRIAKLIRGD